MEGYVFFTCRQLHFVDDVVDGAREARSSAFADACLKRIDSSRREIAVFVSCANDAKKRLLGMNRTWGCRNSCLRGASYNFCSTANPGKVSTHHRLAYVSHHS